MENESKGTAEASLHLFFNSKRKMLEIGVHTDKIHLKEGTIASAILSYQHNRLMVLHGGDSPLDLATINQIKKIETIPIKRWRVIGLGMYWTEASTANEDPIVIFGRVGDTDAYGKMTSAITGGEKFNIGDVLVYDPLGILTPNVIVETSATLVITWTKGAEFGEWNSVARDLEVAEAAVAGMTTGYVRPFIVVEIDAEGMY